MFVSVLAKAAGSFGDRVRRFPEKARLDGVLLITPRPVHVPVFGMVMVDVFRVDKVPPDASLPAGVHAPGQAVQFWIGGVSFRNNQIVDFVRPSQGAAVVAGHGALTRHPFTVGQLGLSLHDDRIVVGAARIELACIVQSGLPGGTVCRLPINSFR